MALALHTCVVAAAVHVAPLQRYYSAGYPAMETWR